MTVITGEERQRYLDVLAEYRFVGFLEWLDDARRQLAVFLPDHNQLSVGEILYRYVRDGGDVVRKDENRDTWKNECRLHYDMVVEIDGRDIYFETRFDERRRGFEKILIVHVHPPGQHFQHRLQSRD